MMMSLMSFQLERAKFAICWNAHPSIMIATEKTAILVTFDRLLWISPRIMLLLRLCLCSEQRLDSPFTHLVEHKSDTAPIIKR